MGFYTPGQCITIFNIVSNLLTVTVCVAAAVLLFLAPEQPYLIVYNAGSYAVYPALVLAITAIVAVVLVLLGCLAVVCDSKCLLASYSVVTFAVALLLFGSSTSLFTFTYSTEVRDELSSVLRRELTNYSEAENSTSGSRINDVQVNFDCCGVDSYKNWRDWNTRWSNETKDNATLAPQSCCLDEFSNNDNCTQHQHQLKTNGCINVLLVRFKPLVDTVFALCLLLAALQVFTGLMALYGVILIRKYQHYDVL